ncbi:MAG TPA: MlaD family protein [Chitinophagaceae bacterium]|jgi:phospholipid/cholesterol/gamma-HCH transport system substrate-binding protein|nr:MlaD family protein [Chitinophagaceae bacterium]
MKISGAQKIKTGAFVLLSLLLLLAFVFLIGRQKNMFASTYTVYASFKNISGLKEGNYVRYAGINVGNVDNISILNDTTVLVMLMLQKKIQPHIKEDATASIGSDGLMGDKLIAISPGSYTSPVVKDGGKLRAANPVDVDRIVNNLSKISDNAEVLTGSLASVMTKINNGEGSFGRLINSDKLVKNMEGTLSSAQQTVSTVQKTASNATETMEAAKHSFLLRGYFRRKEKKRIKDSTEKANKEPAPLSDKTSH